MKGIVLASHGPMAEGVLETSKLFFGEQAQLTARCLEEGMDPTRFDEMLKEAISEVDTGDGVIVFVDLLFGSPCNSMMRILSTDPTTDKISVFTGLNLPMLLQILATREAGNPTSEEIVNAGLEGVKDFNEIVRSAL